MYSDVEYHVEFRNGFTGGWLHAATLKSVDAARFEACHLSRLNRGTFYRVLEKSERTLIEYKNGEAADDAD